MQNQAKTLMAVSWAMYIVGAILVFGSYVNLVPTGIAWGGWIVGIAGWLLGAYVRRMPNA